MSASTPVQVQSGQALQPPGFDDYGQWESLSRGGSRGGFSPDGRWIAYGINRTNRENELRLRKITDGTTEVIEYGSQPVYSSDSKWFAYRVGRSESERERLRENEQPVQDDLGYRNLETGDVFTVEGINMFTFSPDGGFLVMRRYTPERSRESSRGGPGGSDEGEPGATILIRDLATGQDVTFGNVSQFAWQDREDGHLLAMLISAAGRTGNGVHLFDPETSRLRVLESSEADYSNLTWRDDAPDLAVLRSTSDEGKEGSTEVILAWTGLGGRREAAFSYDPTTDSAFPAGMRTVTAERNRRKGAKAPGRRIPRPLRSGIGPMSS